MRLIDTHASQAWMGGLVTEHTEFFSKKACECKRFKYTKRAGEIYDSLDYLTDQMPEPPTCGDCGLWFDYRRNCLRCQDEYFSWFRHPRNLPLMFWCWNCTVEYSRRVNPHRPNERKLKPHPSTLPPGYTLYEPQLKNADGLASIVSSFQEFLKGV